MTIRRVLPLAAVLLFAVSCASSRPDPTVARIDGFVARAMKEFPEVPSLGVAVVRDGKTLLARGYGVRDVEQHLPADEDTAYYIASSTKSYVALLTTVLAQRGLVDLDAPITRYLTELHFGTGVVADKVTLRTLLTHTSGIESDAIVMRTAFSGEHTAAMLVELLGRSKAVEPKFAYDNLGYVAAALVLERVTGKKWQDLIATELFAPLGMTHTTAYMSGTATWPLAKAYDLGRDGRVHPLSFVKTDTTMHAAGGIVTTPRDLARWLEANVNAGAMNGRQALPAAAFAEAHRRQVDTPSRDWYRFRRYAYALGWYHSDYEGTTMLHHFGGYEGWRAHVSFLPQQKHGVAIVTNSSGTGAPVRDLIAAYIYDVLLGKPDVDVAYEAHLAKMRREADEQLVTYRTDVEKRGKRPWMLAHERSAYAGEYVNDLYGTLRVRTEGSDLRASLGQLDAVLEPFIEAESARVELIPGTGEVLRFEFSSGERPASVKFRDEVFRRAE